MATRPKKKRPAGEEKGGRGQKRPHPPDGKMPPKLPKKQPGDPGYDPYDFISSESEGEEEGEEEEGEGESTAPTESHDQEDGMETTSAPLSEERSVADSAIPHLQCNIVNWKICVYIVKLKKYIYIKSEIITLYWQKCMWCV